jgi:sodium/proline symporter
MIFSSAGAMLTGFLGIAYYSKKGLEISDPETIFIELGNILFHPFITGFLISAILAAVMSTISSQLLVTSSSLTEDLYKTFFRRSASDKELVFLGRLSVLVVSIIALCLAWTQNNTILGLVSYAWAGFGAAFGPVILLSLYWARMTKWGALAGMIIGATTVIVWSKLGLSDVLYEIVPGFAASLLAVYIVSLLTSKPSVQVSERFSEFTKSM